MRISIDDLKNRLSIAASRHIPGTEAAYFSNLSLETHLRKAPRMNPLREAVDDIEKWNELN